MAMNRILAAEPQHRALWIGLLISGGIGFSLFFACATPFAAIATVAALKLRPRDGAAVVGLDCVVNQSVGFGVLDYPWTWNCVAWGLAIGVSALLAWLSSGVLASSRPVRFAISLPFVGAFAAYELGLYGASFVLSGGDGAFMGSVIKQVFLINAGAFIGFLAVHRLMLALVSRPSVLGWTESLSH